MIVYNSKDWLRFLFTLRTSDTARRLAPFLLVTFIYSLGIAFVELNYMNLSETKWVKNMYVMHNLLGFAISILLVFRTNTAYERWWEGRKLWGALVNNSRNLALKVNAMLPLSCEDDLNFFREMIPAYAHALRDHLQSEGTRFMLDEKVHPELAAIDKERHIPNQIAGMMIQRINTLYKRGTITGDQLIILNGEISSFTDICGACERIKNTPIPYSYTAFIKKFIFVYVLTLPIGYVFQLGYWVAPIVTFVFYVLGSLELIAEEIEDPFGFDSNDLPMQKIEENIRKHIGEILK